MSEKEIEQAMESLFRGALKVRARKYAKKLSNSANRELTAKIALQIRKDEEDYIEAA